MTIVSTGKRFEKGNLYPTTYYDSAFGNDQKIDDVKVKIGKGVFEQLNPSRLKLEELFVRVLKVKEATGLYSKVLFELKEIK